MELNQDIFRVSYDFRVKVDFRVDFRLILGFYVLKYWSDIALLILWDKVDLNKVAVG